MEKAHVASALRGFAHALIGASLLALLHGGPARAQALPPPGVIGLVSFNLLTPPPIDVGAFGHYPLSGFEGDLLLDVGGTPSPFITASAQILPNFFGRANSMVQYSVQVLGPTATVAVQVAVAGGVAGTSSLGPAPGDIFHGFALKSQWSLQDAASNTVFSEGIVTPALQGSFSDGFNHVVDLQLNVGAIYRVTLIADASARSGSAFAFIDPVFSFAAGVGEGYSFVFSEGIGNAPIPEPSSAALFVAGLLGLAALRRRAQSSL
jgi:hypothetical protein